MLDAAGWVEGDDGIRQKGDQKLSFNLYVRSESQENTQDARLVKEMAAEVGINFDVQVVSVDKLTELTTQKTDGKPAPDFDTFIWGWGGDPYDPSTLLQLITTSQIGGSSDAFYSNPEYDRLFDEQAGEYDLEKRKPIVKRLVEISQEDLPYLVLTVDPYLQAYRTDALSGVELSCPKPNGDLVLRAGVLRAVGEPRPAAGGGRRARLVVGRRRRLERTPVRGHRARGGGDRAAGGDVPAPPPGR